MAELQAHGARHAGRYLRVEGSLRETSQGSFLLAGDAPEAVISVRLSAGAAGDLAECPPEAVTLYGSLARGAEPVFVVIAASTPGEYG